jgi:hypothetical protein
MTALYPRGIVFLDILPQTLVVATLQQDVFKTRHQLKRIFELD